MDRLRAGIVGCGQIARVHVSALRATPCAHLVALCDRDQWRARDLAEHAVQGDEHAVQGDEHAGGGISVYTDLSEMLRRAKPDIVHVVTPPSTHATLAIQALESGSHVLVEKPMALTTDGADRMLSAARDNGRVLSCDHNYLFKPCITRARRLVSEGAVGQVLYVHGYYGVSGEASAHGPAPAQSHWAWRLPGKAFSNLLPHLIYLLRAFVGSMKDVPSLSLLPDPETGLLPTELTAQVIGSEALGTMVISMRARPYAKYVDIVGTKGMIHADLVREICTFHGASPLPGKVSKALLGLEDGAQVLGGTMRNVAKMALGKMRGYPGLHSLVRQFYEDIAEGRPAAVTAEDAAETVAVLARMAATIDSMVSARVEPHRSTVLREPVTQAERRFVKAGREGRVLVTGATGFLGRHLVSALHRCGATITVLVRDRTRVSPDLERCAEIVQGDLRNANDVRAAMRDVTLVFHCAAATSNRMNWHTHNETNVRGSENVFMAVLDRGVRRVIHVSSVIVYGLDGKRTDNPIDETAPYADAPDRWAHYMRSKIQADRLALEMVRERGLPVTVMRLGILYGPGNPRLPGTGLLRARRWRFVLGGGRNAMPFTYVGNAVDALLLAAITPQATGQAYNVVDDPQVTVREAARLDDAGTGDYSSIMPVPAFALSTLARLLEYKSRRDGPVPPRVSRFVVRSACRNLYYDTTRIKQDLGWIPEISLAEGLRRTRQAQD